MGGNVSKEEARMNLDRKRSEARDVKKICFGKNRKLLVEDDVNGKY